MAAHKLRKKGVATTFEVIRNYRELLGGKMSRAEYVIRVSEEIEKPHAPLKKNGNQEIKEKIKTSLVED